MSTILDALRRLQRERELAEPSSDLGESMLGGEIQPSRPRRSRAPIVVGGALVALLAAGGSLAYFSGSDLELPWLGAEPDAPLPERAEKPSPVPPAATQPRVVRPRARARVAPPAPSPRAPSEAVPRPSPPAASPSPTPSPPRATTRPAPARPVPSPTPPPEPAAQRPRAPVRVAQAEPAPDESEERGPPPAIEPLPLEFRSTLGPQYTARRPVAEAEAEVTGFLGFPELTVEVVRWHPDPDRRRARILLDGTRPVEARQGDIVAGVAIDRIDPGGVELRMGSSRKHIQIGR